MEFKKLDEVIYDLMSPWLEFELQNTHIDRYPLICELLKCEIENEFVITEYNNRKFIFKIKTSKKNRDLVFLEDYNSSHLISSIINLFPKYQTEVSLYELIIEYILYYHSRYKFQGINDEQIIDFIIINLSNAIVQLIKKEQTTYKHIWVDGLLSSLRNLIHKYRILLSLEKNAH